MSNALQKRSNTKRSPHSAPKKRPLNRWTWYYYSLAGFHVLTIAISLGFGHVITKQYRSTIELNDYWAKTLSYFVDMTSAVNAASAPGNDIFATKHVASERELKRAADKSFFESLGLTREHLTHSKSQPEQTESLFSNLNIAATIYNEIDIHTEATFSNYEAGNIEEAIFSMVAVDRSAAETSEAIGDSINIVTTIQHQSLKAEEQQLSMLSKIEYYIAGAVCMIVVIALMFGNKMSRHMREQEISTEESKLAAEKALRELSSQSFALDEHAIVAVTDTAGRIQYVNDKFCLISKYEREELIGQDHRILNSGHHSKSFFGEMYKTIANGEVWRGEVKNLAKDGSNYWVNTTVVPYRNESGKIDRYVAIREDITLRKKAERELKAALSDARDAKTLAESANKAKSDFLATISHEIRTPMNGIIGFGNLLLDSSLPEPEHSHVKAIINSGQSLLTIINDILDFSKIEAEKLEVEAIPFDLQQVTEETVELLANQANENEIELLLRYHPELPKGFVCDPCRVRQLILNLLSNALKFTQKGHVLIDIVPHAKDDAKFVRISISDTGMGISTEAQTRLFQKFTQADSSTSRKFGGTGLGLATCKQLTELMGGEIGFDSVENSGSNFWFTLPFPETPVDLPQRSNALDISGHRILVVDDYKLSQVILQEQCSLWKLECEIASNGNEALEKLRQAKQEGRPFEVALLDYDMPAMNGEELGIAILEDSEICDTKLILLTPGYNRAERSRLLAAGFHEFFIKPIITLEELRNKIGSALGIHPNLAPSDSTNSSSLNQKAPQGNFHLLVVDDNSVNQILLQTILGKKFGYIVECARNGKEAVAMVKRFDYDAILMDCMMPEMDGFEATEKIRDFESRTNKEPTPIIALTANALKGDDEKCYKHGMDDYLAKPIDTAKLIQILHKWLANGEVMPTIAPLPIREMEDESYFDTQYLTNAFPSEPEVVSELISRFTENLEELSKSIQEGPDIDQLQFASHSAKGAAAECGAARLNAVAGELELACISQDTAAAYSLTGEFLESISRTLSDIRKFENQS